MAVTISGMFGSDKTYFINSPVVVKVNGLEWPGDHEGDGDYRSPFTVCRLQVLYTEGEDSSSSSSNDGADESIVVGEFRADTGNKSEISFDISSALRAIWSDYKFETELGRAQAAVGGSNTIMSRDMRAYSLRVYTEYISSDGVFTSTNSGTFSGGQCVIGGFTEIERSWVANPDVSVLQKTHVRNGDASTKPISSPEIVGKNSITSWVDVTATGTTCRYYNAGANQAADDVIGSQNGWTGHAPIVARDSVPYTDFLFINRRGAVETCSAQMLEALDISVETKQYARVGKPSFRPERSLMAIPTGGRRSWSMSSGFQTREWAEWWTMEFLMASRWWMLYEGKFVPVSVSPAKKSTSIYDKTKQKMPSVEFTVTMALEG